MYRLRWGVELQFRSYKQTFGRSKLLQVFGALWGEFYARAVQPQADGGAVPGGHPGRPSQQRYVCS